jgi:hypothetical protein
MSFIEDSWCVFTLFAVPVFPLRCKSRREPKTLGDRLLRLCTDKTVDEFTILKDEHRRYAGDLKTRRCLRVIVDI